MFACQVDTVAYVGLMPTAEALPTTEAARRLGVSRRTLTRMVRSGVLRPVLKAPGLKGAYFFDPAEIDRVAAEGAQLAEVGERRG